MGQNARYGFVESLPSWAERGRVNGEQADAGGSLGDRLIGCCIYDIDHISISGFMI
jgi:hypothetical protein